MVARNGGLLQCARRNRRRDSGIRRTSVLFKHIKSAGRSDSFHTAVIFGVSGLAFSASNILFARHLSVDDYATVALVIAIIAMSSGLGLFGADGIVNRHDVRPDFRIFARILCTSALMAFLSAGAALQFYGIDLRVALLLGIAIVAQAAIYFVAAYLRSRHEIRSSLLTFNSSNYIFLAVAIAAGVYGWRGIFLPVALITVALLLTAVWAVASVRLRYASVVSSYKYSWREALVYISLTGSGLVLIQLERIVTPKLLTLHDLATLGVLLAIVGPPFRLLQLSLGYALLPKLRQAGSTTEKSSLIVREIAIALALLVPCWLLTWYLVPVLDRMFFGFKYPLGGELIVAVIVAGTIKAVSGIATASVTGLASAKSLEVTAGAAWIAVAMAVGGAYVGSAFGLAGVVYGVSIGWLVRIVTAWVIVSKHMAGNAEGDAEAPVVDTALQ